MFYAQPVVTYSYTPLLVWPDLCWTYVMKKSKHACEALIHALMITADLLLDERIGSNIPALKLGS
jgi:hypothetical protein